MIANPPTTQTMEHVQQIEFRAMGSQVLAAVESADPEVARLLAEVPRWFAGWEQTLSRFKEDSELSQLNGIGSISAPVPVSDTLWRVLELSLQAARYTRGLVTPTVLNALEADGYDTGFDVMTPGALSDSPAHRAGTNGNQYAAQEAQKQAQPDLPSPGMMSWHKIRTYPETHTVRMPRGVRLDFGGIAKGWAADEAAGRLAKYGPAVVNAGGDIAVGGPPLHGSGWLIGVDAPTFPGFPQDAPIELLCIRSGGVATSGRDYRRWQQGGEWHHHISDPRTGSPVNTDLLAATVVAPTACMAEIGAKVALLLGGARGLEWLEARPSLAGLLVFECGKIAHSRRLEHHLWGLGNAV
jgi:thiamine biosynthesis lipoprotein